MVEGRERVIKVMEDNKLGGCRLLFLFDNLNRSPFRVVTDLYHTRLVKTVQKLGVGVISRKRNNPLFIVTGNGCRPTRSIQDVEVKNATRSDAFSRKIFSKILFYRESFDKS